MAMSIAHTHSLPATEMNETNESSKHCTPHKKDVVCC